MQLFDEILQNIIMFTVSARTFLIEFRSLDRDPEERNKGSCSGLISTALLNWQ